jgi:hypothetical protein
MIVYTLILILVQTRVKTILLVTVQHTEAVQLILYSVSIASITLIKIEDSLG